MLNRNTVIAIMLFALLMLATSCSGGSYERIKLNADMVKEYNDAIELYNKTAISFTDLARLVEDGNANNTLFSEAFWEEFTKKSDKVYKNIDNISSFEFTYEQTVEVKKDLQSFVQSIRKYLEYIASHRDKEMSTAQEAFISSHRDMYDVIMDMSAHIVEKFDHIYNFHIVGID